MYARSGLWLCLVVVAIALAVVACGSDTGGEGAANPPPENVAEPALPEPAEQAGAPQAVPEPPAELEPTPPVVTRDEFVVAADAICADADTKLDALKEPESLDELQAFFEQAIAIQEDQIERLRALELPAGDAETVAHAYDLLDQIVELAKGAQDSIANGDLTILDALDKEIEPLQTEADQIALELGLLSCGTDNSNPMPDAALAAAGCELFPPAPSQVTPQNNHVLELPQGFEYNTFPPTQGPHHPQTLLFNLYSQPVEQINLVHNLEHGGMYVQYGDQVSAEDIAAIAAWWDQDPNGLIIAPLPALEQNIALGAWTTESGGDYENSVGRLAYCPTFEKAAFDAFKNAYRGKGPERIPVSVLTPGFGS